QHTILEIQNANFGDSLASGEPKEIGGMIVAQCPNRTLRNDILDRLPPKIDESGLDAGGKLHAGDIRRIPVVQKLYLDRKGVNVIGRNPVGHAVIEGQSVRKICVMQMR